MRKNVYVALLLLLILATGCSFTMTRPVDLAEKLPSSTEEPTATPTLLSGAPTPTFTTVASPKEVETKPDETSQAVETTAAVEEKKPGLFFFYADWCSACTQMRPVIEKLKPEYSDRIRFVMVNVDDPEARELVAVAGVRAIPLTIFVTSPDGQAQQWVGPRPESVLRNALMRRSNSLRDYWEYYNSNLKKGFSYESCSQVCSWSRKCRASRCAGTDAWSR